MDEQSDDLIADQTLRAIDVAIAFLDLPSTAGFVGEAMQGNSQKRRELLAGYANLVNHLLTRIDPTVEGRRAVLAELAVLVEAER